MEWWIWLAKWTIFCYRYSRLFRIYFKKHRETIDNLSIRIYGNKTENKITFKIKTGYYLEPLTPEIMKLLGSMENKIAKY